VLVPFTRRSASQVHLCLQVVAIEKGGGLVLPDLAPVPSAESASTLIAGNWTESNAIYEVG